MNPLIERLMREAGYAEPKLAFLGQKLAELVVAECIRECRAVERLMRGQEAESNTIDFGRGPTKNRQQTAALCGEAIRKKFNHD